MSSTMTRTEVEAAPSAAEAEAQRQPLGRSALRATLRTLGFLASLRLTVVLLGLSIFLTFAGTLAQVDKGIWRVMEEYFRTPLAWIELQLFFPRSVSVPGAFPFPGGWLIGGLLMTNLIAAHAVRFKLTWKRSGILVIHAGLIVLLSSEFVTGMWAEEGNMVIPEGASTNFVEDHRTAELAIIDHSDPQHERVTTVPEALLDNEGLIRHESLPFDIQVERYMVNSRLIAASQHPGDPPATATAGGRQWAAEERPEVSGVDPNQNVDFDSAYITLLDKRSGEPLGTYLVSAWLNDEEPQQVAVDGRTYDLHLRFKRLYKPFTVHLIDFKHERYLGTDTPKNYESVVRLIDPAHDVDRQVRIYMNHPLRYAGHTFFQASFLQGDRGTVLQVVENPGWLLPYIACTMVAVGLLVHFCMSLGRFLRRRAKA